jgi:flavorubredoxin
LPTPTSSYSLGIAHNMRICIVYLSRFGHNRRVAETLTSYLREKGIEVYTYSHSEIRRISIPDARLYIVCTPTRFGRPPNRIARYLWWVSIDEPDARYAIITTHFKRHNRVIHRLSAILDRKGLTPAHEGMTLKVSGVKGPLERGFEAKLRDFADTCLSVVS